jgi:hypothetical protein
VAKIKGYLDIARKEIKIKNFSNICSFGIIVPIL